MPHQDIPCRRTMSVLNLDAEIATMQADDAHCRPSRPDRYAELAHTTRAGRAVLPADQLLPCDSILLDGELLVIADLRITELMVILEFENLDWGCSISRRRLVRLA
jgi:hypothetical protein